jgi:hypothetical protein
MIGFRFPTWPFGFPLEKQWWTLVGHGIQPPKGFIPVHIESFWIPRFPKCQLNHTFLLDANAWLNAKKRPWSVGAHQSFDEIRRSAQSLVHLGWSRFFWQNPVNPFNPMQNTPLYSDIYNDIYIYWFLGPTLMFLRGWNHMWMIYNCDLWGTKKFCWRMNFHQSEAPSKVLFKMACWTSVVLVERQHQGSEPTTKTLGCTSFLILFIGDFPICPYDSLCLFCWLLPKFYLLNSNFFAGQIPISTCPSRAKSIQLSAFRF